MKEDKATGRPSKHKRYRKPKNKLQPVLSQNSAFYDQDTKTSRDLLTHEQYVEQIKNDMNKSPLDKLKSIKTNILEDAFQSLPRSDKMAIELFRNINRPIYHKHYVAAAFKEMFQSNPFDHYHFLDETNNPDLGVHLNSALDANSGTFRSPLSAAQPLYTNEQNKLNEIQNPHISSHDMVVNNFEVEIAKEKAKTIADLSIRPQDAYQMTLPTINFFGRGTRKNSTAVVYISRPGTGLVTVNNREFIEYFYDDADRHRIMRPIIKADKLCEFDLRIFTYGGGYSGQSTACAIAVAKAIGKAYPETNQVLKDAGMFWTDTRKVEPKATGKYKARKSFTYVRR